MNFKIIQEMLISSKMLMRIIFPEILFPRLFLFSTNNLSNLLIELK